MEQRALPRHVAIIMDGNGRWAEKNNVSRNEGHRKGTKVLEKMVRYANEIGIEYLTVYAFSTENWNRPQKEVDGLMNLMRQYLDNHLKSAKKDDIKFNVIGNREKLPDDIQLKIEKLEKLTCEKKGLVFNIALNYGGKDEIIRACKNIVSDVIENNISVESIDEELFGKYLDTRNQPDPDLMIRTSGEIRTSNFLPWQLTYSEFYFTSILWPEFTISEFDKALEEYSRRKRRFGKSE